MRNITLQTDGMKICGELYFPENNRTPYPTVCICHGIPAKRFDPADRGYAELAERVSGSGLAALIFNPGLLHTAWRSFRRMPLLAQIVVALFTLPVTLGL